MQISLHVGPSWIVGPNTEASLLASRRQQWSADKPVFVENSLRFESAQRLGAQWVAIEKASWHERRYEQSKHPDGPRWDLSLTGRWQATPLLSLSLTAGYGEKRKAQPALSSPDATLGPPLGFLRAAPGLQLGSLDHPRPQLLPTRLVLSHPGTRETEGSLSHLPTLDLQPRPYPLRLQPAAGADPGRARVERPVLRLRTPPR